MSRGAGGGHIPAVKAVLFDLDGTLLDRRRSFEIFIAGQHQRFARALAETSPQDYLGKAVELDFNGYAAREQVFGGLAEHFGLSSRVGAEMLRDFKIRFASSCVPFRGADVTLDGLRAAGLALALVTNGTAQMQGGKVSHLGLGPRFDAILVSDIEGVRKPEAAIFQRAVHRLGVRADEAVHVGDDPDADIRGAKNAGLRAVWRRSDFWVPPTDADAAIDDIRELAGVVSSWRL